MKPKTLVLLLACILGMAGVLSDVGPASAQGIQVTARDVVDRETLQAFVQGAIQWLSAQFESEEGVSVAALKEAFRMEGGPWKHGSTYFLVLIKVGGIVFFHGGDQTLENLPGLQLEDVNGKKYVQELIAAAEMGGGFVEYYVDDPLIMGDEETGTRRISFAVPITAPASAGAIAGIELVFSAGFNPGDAPMETDRMTTFVPVVLSSAGLNDSFFTSELTLTNRDSEPAMLNYTYTAHRGGGSGTATDMLGPLQQKIKSNAITYLRGLEVPIPETGSRIGTLRVDVSGSSEVSVVVRTTTAVPNGRAGLAYLGIPGDEGFQEEAVYLCGLRQNPQDRSNVAFQNMGGEAEGAITVRTTVFSGDAADSSPRVLGEVMLGPGKFHQYSGVLRVLDSMDGNRHGYVKVEKVEGTAPFYAYGVINDQANSDGSFVFPVSESSLAGKMGQILPVVIERGAYTSELTVTNFSDEAKAVTFRVVADAIETEDHTVAFALPLLPGQQYIIPNAIDTARQQFGINLPSGLAVPLFASAAGGDMSGVVIGARTGSLADPKDVSKGQYSVFYTAVPQGAGFTRSAWIDGLQQNEENRSNLALVNTGEVDDSESVFEIDIYDGETAVLVKTVTIDDNANDTTVAAKRFHQINGILRTYAPGTTQGYVRIRKVSGENPFLAYGVVNDGGIPRQRSDDGAYIPARK